MEILPRERFQPAQRVGVIWKIFFEILVLIFLSVLEYYMRATDAFPVRNLKFSCSDASIQHTQQSGRDAMGMFAYQGQVPYVAVMVLSFFLPPVIMFICELVRWSVSKDDERMTVVALCSTCNITSFIRRFNRFTATFIFGILTTMIFTDVTKFMIGRLRPVFLDVCMVNSTLCNATDIGLHGDEVCRQSNSMQLRWARLSFPSIQASVTAFSAGFMAIYWQSVIGNGLKCRIIGPFISLTFIIMSLLCCLDLYSLYLNHWTDVAVGFLIGIIFAVYICCFVLENFVERDRAFYNQLEKLLRRDKHFHDWEMRNDKVPWSWAPWQWTVQERVQGGRLNETPPPNYIRVNDVNTVRRQEPRDRHVTSTMYY